MDWLKKIREDENAALHEIYLNFRGSCVQFLKSCFQISHEDALEVFQVSVVVLYQNVIDGHLNSVRSNLRTYLYAIAKNKAREMIRENKKNGRYGAYHLLLSNVAESTEDKIRFENSLDRVHRLMLQMGDPCRTILQMYYYKELGQDEISRIMGYSSSDSVKTTKNRCIKRLRSMMNPN